MKERILEVLKNAEKPLRPGEIAAALGEDKDAVSKAIKELKAEENANFEYVDVLIDLLDRTEIACEVVSKGLI